MSGRDHIEDMRRQASKLRADATAQDGYLRDWTLSRAAFFDRCADEVQAELDAEQSTAA